MTPKASPSRATNIELLFLHLAADFQGPLPVDEKLVVKDVKLPDPVAIVALLHLLDHRLNASRVVRGAPAIVSMVVRTMLEPRRDGDSGLARHPRYHLKQHIFNGLRL